MRCEANRSRILYGKKSQRGSQKALQCSGLWEREKRRAGKGCGKIGLPGKTYWRRCRQQIQLEQYTTYQEKTALHGETHPHAETETQALNPEDTHTGLLPTVPFSLQQSLDGQVIQAADPAHPVPRLQLRPAQACCQRFLGLAVCPAQKHFVTQVQH